MREKKKIDESIIWLTAMTVLPVVVLMNVGSEFGSDSGGGFVYAGLFSGIGGMIGAVANHLTTGKSRVIKMLTIIGIIAMIGLVASFLLSEPTDTEIIESEWITQKIGGIEFDSPTKLTLFYSEIPDSLEWFYSDLNVYKDNDDERLTVFYQAKVQIDTLTLEYAYAQTLSGMLIKLDVNIDDIEIEDFGIYEDEIATMFTFDLKGTKVNGYGLMYINGEKMESIWLMPIKKGFSKEYIEVFDLGVVPSED